MCIYKYINSKMGSFKKETETPIQGKNGKKRHQLQLKKKTMGGNQSINKYLAYGVRFKRAKISTVLKIVVNTRPCGQFFRLVLVVNL